MSQVPNSLERISRIFKAFAERECRNRSPLYFQLANEIAEKPELLEMASHCRNRQPIPNLFLAAVHDLLLAEPDHELAQDYPSITGAPSQAICVQGFSKFCQAQRSAIIERLQNRRVQTNALNRTAYLMPIISTLLANSANADHSILIDFGASAGLCLNYDLYRYDYQTANGELKIGLGPTTIQSQIKNTAAQQLNQKALFQTLRQLSTNQRNSGFQGISKAARKIAIEQAPIDVTDESQARWLKALIWPDLNLRFERLNNALAQFRDSTIEWRQSQTNLEFEQILNSLPKTGPLILYHTHVLYQFTAQERQGFRAIIERLGQQRDLHYIAAESPLVFDKPTSAKTIRVELTSYCNGDKQQQHLANTDGHANWIEWIVEASD